MPASSGAVENDGLETVNDDEVDNWVGGGSSSASDDAALIRRFLEDAGVLYQGDGVITVDEMRGYVRGLIAG